MTTVQEEEDLLSQFEMPKLTMGVSKEGIKIIIQVPVIMMDGQPEPDARDKNGRMVIINPDYRRIWMAYYYPHLSNSPGSGNWYCKNCSCKGDRFYMKSHVDLRACDRNSTLKPEPKPRGKKK